MCDQCFFAFLRVNDLCRDSRAAVFIPFLFVGMHSLGMVLLELITRKKIGENGFARRTAAKLFALEAEEVRQESPSDAPDSLLNLAAMWVSVAPTR